MTLSAYLRTTHASSPWTNHHTRQRWSWESQKAHMDMARHVPGAEDLPSLALVTVGAQISQETRPGVTKHHEEAQHSLVEIVTDQAKLVVTSTHRVMVLRSTLSASTNLRMKTSTLHFCSSRQLLPGLPPQQRPLLSRRPLKRRRILSFIVTSTFV